MANHHPCVAMRAPTESRPSYKQAFLQSKLAQRTAKDKTSKKSFDQLSPILSRNPSTTSTSISVNQCQSKSRLLLKAYTRGQTPQTKLASSVSPLRDFHGRDIESSPDSRAEFESPQKENELEQTVVQECSSIALDTSTDDPYFIIYGLFQRTVGALNKQQALPDIKKDTVLNDFNRWKVLAIIPKGTVKLVKIGVEVLLDIADRGGPVDSIQSKLLRLTLETLNFHTSPDSKLTKKRMLHYYRQYQTHKTFYATLINLSIPQIEALKKIKRTNSSFVSLMYAFINLVTEVDNSVAVTMQKEGKSDLRPTYNQQKAWEICVHFLSSGYLSQMLRIFPKLFRNNKIPLWKINKTHKCMQLIDEQELNQMECSSVLLTLFNFVNSALDYSNFMKRPTLRVNENINSQRVKIESQSISLPQRRIKRIQRNVSSNHFDSLPSLVDKIEKLPLKDALNQQDYIKKPLSDKRSDLTNPSTILDTIQKFTDNSFISDSSFLDAPQLEQKPLAPPIKKAKNKRSAKVSPRPIVTTYIVPTIQVISKPIVPICQKLLRRPKSVPRLVAPRRAKSGRNIRNTDRSRNSIRSPNIETDRKVRLSKSLLIREFSTDSRPFEFINDQPSDPRSLCYTFSSHPGDTFVRELSEEKLKLRKKLQNEEKRRRWEEFRRVRYTQIKQEKLQAERQELLNEINYQKSLEKEFSARQKARDKREKENIRRFQEQEIQEQRRIKQLQRQQSQRDLEDDLKRNEEKRRLVSNNRLKESNHLLLQHPGSVSRNSSDSRLDNSWQLSQVRRSKRNLKTIVEKFKKGKKCS